jgi:muconate cycloisomerase
LSRKKEKIAAMAGQRPQIVAVEVWKATFPFRMTFTHNLASRRDAATLVVLLADSRGLSGYGQVLARDYLTGESLESAAAAIRERWWPAVRSLSFPVDAEPDVVLALLDSLFREADSLRLSASYAGVDAAVFSLAARGGRFPRITEPLPLVGVVPAVSPRKAAWLVRALRGLGYRRFKVKVGRDADADAARLDAVRRAAGKGVWIAVDANAAWDEEEAVRRMRELARLGVALVEEPLRREDAAKADFRRLEEQAGIPVMADESLCTMADANSLLERGSPSWWNLRVAKNGGVSGVAAIAALAKAAGVRVYGGILVGETGALAAAGRCVFPLVGAVCGEYGFSRVFLQGDPFRGAPAGYRGLYCGAWGWGGMEMDRRALAARGELLYRDER